MFQAVDMVSGGQHTLAMKLLSATLRSTAISSALTRLKGALVFLWLDPGRPSALPGATAAPPETEWWDGRRATGVWGPTSIFDRFSFEPWADGDSSLRLTGAGVGASSSSELSSSSDDDELTTRGSVALVAFVAAGLASATDESSDSLSELEESSESESDTESVGLAVGLNFVGDTTSDSSESESESESESVGLMIGLDLGADAASDCDESESDSDSDSIGLTVGLDLGTEATSDSDESESELEDLDLASSSSSESDSLSELDETSDASFWADAELVFGIGLAFELSESEVDEFDSESSDESDGSACAVCGSAVATDEPVVEEDELEFEEDELDFEADEPAFKTGELDFELLLEEALEELDGLESESESELDSPELELEESELELDSSDPGLEGVFWALSPVSVWEDNRSTLGFWLILGTFLDEASLSSLLESLALRSVPVLIQIGIKIMRTDITEGS